MDELTVLVHREIKSKYRSVRQFALEIGIPQSTIISALHKGIGGTSFDTVMKICRILNIKPIFCESPTFLNEDGRELVDGYRSLDDFGKHTLMSVLKVEKMRMEDEKKKKSELDCSESDEFVDGDL